MNWFLLKCVLVGIQTAFFWWVWGNVKCEYPTGGMDWLPLHAQIMLTLLSVSVTGLVTVALIELYHDFFR